MDKQNDRRHILCVAFPAYGHMIPLLALARKISEYHDVTFAVSQGQHDELKRREILKDGDAHIKLFGIEDNFFGDMEDPTNMPLMMEIFKKIMGGVGKLMMTIPTHKEPAAPGFGIQRPVDVVITDNMIAGAVAPVKSRGPLFFLFNTANAAFNLMVLQFKDDHPECDDDDAESFAKMPKPGEPLPPVPRRFKPLMISMRQNIVLADGIIMNSFRGAEEEVIGKVQQEPEMAHIPIYCVGPLIPQVEETNVKHQITEQRVAKWLAAKPAGSVIYVSFGSIAQPNPEQLQEIAEALKTIDQPFIWSLKAKHHEHLPEEFQKTITSNLEDVDSKYLIVPWAPQKLLLAHPSVAVFISHCGWNSTLEGLASGKPFVAWPQFGDQLINGEFLEVKGAAVIIRDAGTKKGRLVKAEEIVDTVKKAETECAPAAKMWGEKLRSAIEPGQASDQEFGKLMRKYSEL